MSVKKAESTAKKPSTKKEEVKEDEVKVETTTNVEVTTEEPNEALEEVKGVNLEVDETPVDNSTQAKEKNVRIKMRCDHKCWFAGVCYELKQGVCYTVPSEVKMRLSKADVLLPL